MSAKQFCLNNPPSAYMNLFMDEVLYFHGVEHSIHDYVYISDAYGTTVSYHRLMVRYDSVNAYVMYKETRCYLDQFVKIDI